MFPSQQNNPEIEVDTVFLLKTKMLQNVRHIILDLGGVIINIDYKKTEQAFVDLGLTDFGARYSQLQQTDLFDQFETGQSTKEAFISGLRGYIGDEVSDEQIIEAWNALLVDIPLRRLQILQQLQLHYDMFLLSNTNSIHEEVFNKMLKERCGFKSMGVFFDKVYYSHHVGLRKPDAAIFNLILEQNSLDKAKTLFIDDSPQHIETAKALGIQTIWLEPGMTIEEHVFLPKQSRLDA